MNDQQQTTEPSRALLSILFGREATFTTAKSSTFGILADCKDGEMLVLNPHDRHQTTRILTKEIISIKFRSSTFFPDREPWTSTEPEDSGVIL